MKPRILLSVVNISVMYLIVGVAATIIVRAYACADISGEWYIEETATVTCSAAGDSETFTETQSGYIFMNQSGCNISYVHPQVDVTRSGTVGDNTLQMTGPLLLPFAPGINVTENILNITGTIQRVNLIDFTGNGRASGTIDGIRFSCTATSTGTMDRESADLTVTEVTVSTTTPHTGKSFTINATVRNQGTASSNSTTLRYYRSSDSTISMADLQLSTSTVPILFPGGISIESKPVSINASGTFWIGACIDPVNIEYPTTNNCSTGVQIAVTEHVFSIAPMIQLLLETAE